MDRIAPGVPHKAAGTACPRHLASVIEIPAPRRTAYDANRFGIEMKKEVPMVTVERAYTSPIWHMP